MKTVQNIDSITVKVSKDELINGKWLTFQLLSKKLAKIEEDKMELKIRYSLKAEEQVITESAVRIEICPKELKTFEN